MKRTVKPTVWVALGAAGFIFLGSLLPWASLGPFSGNGTQGDGIITLFASLFAAGGILAYAFTDWPRTLCQVVTGLAVLVALGTAVYDTIHIGSLSTTILGQQISVSIGSGLWITLLASIVCAVACVLTVVQEQAKPTAQAPPNMPPPPGSYQDPPPPPYRPPGPPPNPYQQ